MFVGGMLIRKTSSGRKRKVYFTILQIITEVRFAKNIMILDINY